MELNVYQWTQITKFEVKNESFIIKPLKLIFFEEFIILSELKFLFGRRKTFLFVNNINNSYWIVIINYYENESFNVNF